MIEHQSIIRTPHGKGWAGRKMLPDIEDVDYCLGSMDRIQANSINNQSLDSFLDEIESVLEP